MCGCVFAYPIKVAHNTCLFRCDPQFFDLYGLRQDLCGGIDAFKEAIKNFPELRYMRAKGNVMLFVMYTKFAE